MFLILGVLLSFAPPLRAVERPAHAPESYALPTMTVVASPFGKWGIGLNLHYRSMELSTGGPPKAIYVAWIQSGSQAHREGVEVGDEIVAINGTAVTEFAKSEVESLLFGSASRDRIRLHFRHRLNHRPFVVDLVLTPRRPDVFRPVFWGIEVVGDERTPIRLRHGQALQRRTAEVIWSGRSLTLAEEPNGSVQLIEGRNRQRLSPGTELRLRADGGYEIASSEARP